jgi:LPXTG-motif cell wall-anchored protein
MIKRKGKNIMSRHSFGMMALLGSALLLLLSLWLSCTVGVASAQPPRPPLTPLPRPTLVPTNEPTKRPTATHRPAEEPTSTETIAPTEVPSSTPTELPTAMPLPTETSIVTPTAVIPRALPKTGNTSGSANYLILVGLVALAAGAVLWRIAHRVVSSTR